MSLIIVNNNLLRYKNNYVGTEIGYITNFLLKYKYKDSAEFTNFDVGFIT